MINFAWDIRTLLPFFWKVNCEFKYFTFIIRVKLNRKILEFPREAIFVVVVVCFCRHHFVLFYFVSAPPLAPKVMHQTKHCILNTTFHQGDQKSSQQYLCVMSHRTFLKSGVLNYVPFICEKMYLALSCCWAGKRWEKDDRRRSRLGIAISV